MPTYEYACTSCGQHLEVVQSFSDEPLTTCAVCGGPMRKVFGSIGIVLKGSGFYKTDSRPSGSKAAGDQGGGTSGGGGESATASSAKEASSSGSSDTSSGADKTAAASPSS